MVTEAILLGERTDQVLTLRLNRPAVLNSLTDALLDELTDRIQSAASDASVRCIVITGSGRAFCSGQDLTVTEDGVPLDVRGHLRRHYVPLVTAIREVDKPVIAAINGVAAGAGLSLALACDLRIAASSATLINAFVRIGLVPDAGNSYFLPRLIGHARALELSLLGERIDSAEAFRLGLVSQVIPDPGFESATQKFAQQLARGPRSLGLIKRLLAQTWDNTLPAQLAAEEAAQVEAAASRDFHEGVQAFLDKRPPRFDGD